MLEAKQQQIDPPEGDDSEGHALVGQGICEVQQLDEYSQTALHDGGEVGLGGGRLGEGQSPPRLAGSPRPLTGFIHLHRHPCLLDID